MSNLDVRASGEEQDFWAWYWSAEPDSRGMMPPQKKETVRNRLESARASLYIAGYLTEAENARVKHRLEKRARLLRSRRNQLSEEGGEEVSLRREQALPMYSDPNPIVVLRLDAEGLDFLCEELPQRDGFTKELKKFRAQVEAANEANL